MPNLFLDSLFFSFCGAFASRRFCIGDYLQTGGNIKSFGVCSFWQLIIFTSVLDICSKAAVEDLNVLSLKVCDELFSFLACVLFNQ